MVRVHEVGMMGIFLHGGFFSKTIYKNYKLNPEYFI